MNEYADSDFNKTHEQKHFSKEFYKIKPLVL